jgi:hypothetical protein
MKFTRYNEATILCPGKSLELLDYERDTLPQGPTIAVNTAMAEVPQADVWGVYGLTVKGLDDRLAEWGARFELMRGELDVYAIYDFARVYELVSTRKPHYVKYDDHMRASGFDWWVRGGVVQKYIGWQSRVDWSSVPALAMAMIAVKNGARHIRILGADMRGIGYAGVQAGDLKWRDHEDDEHRRRWKRERQALEMAVAECPEHGVTLEVVDIAAVRAAEREAADAPGEAAPGEQGHTGEVEVLPTQPAEAASE